MNQFAEGVKILSVIMELLGSTEFDADRAESRQRDRQRFDHVPGLQPKGRRLTPSTVTSRNTPAHIPSTADTRVATLTNNHCTSEAIFTGKRRGSSPLSSISKRQVRAPSGRDFEFHVHTPVNKSY